MSAQKFGVRTGANLTKLKISNVPSEFEEYQSDHRLKPAFHLGITTEFSLYGNLFIESGLLLSVKGSKMNQAIELVGEPYEASGTINPLYLEIPLELKRYFQVRDNKIFTAIGPYFAYGIGGDFKLDSNFMGVEQSTEEPISWGNDIAENTLKNLDYGMSMGLGMQIKQMQVGLRYAFGLADLNPDTNEESSIARNQNLNLSLTYYLGKGEKI